MTVRIHTGDIFDVEADALVVPANCQPDLGWGSHISERVKKLAGPDVIEQRRAAGRLELGQACVTAGTGTPFAHLIHAAVLDKYDFNPLFLLRLRQRTSDATLEAAVASTLDIARENAIGSLAVSAMGSGIGGMRYEKCLRIILPPCLASTCTCVFSAYKPRHTRIAERVLRAISS